MLSYPVWGKGGAEVAPFIYLMMSLSLLHLISLPLNQLPFFHRSVTLKIFFLFYKFLLFLNHSPIIFVKLGMHYWSNHCNTETCTTLYWYNIIFAVLRWHCVIAVFTQTSTHTSLNLFHTVLYKNIVRVAHTVSADVCMPISWLCCVELIQCCRDGILRLSDALFSSDDIAPNIFYYAHASDITYITALC